MGMARLERYRLGMIPGIASSRYYPAVRTIGIARAQPAPGPPTYRSWSDKCALQDLGYDRFGVDQGDPRGRMHTGARRGCVGHWPPPYAPALRPLPWRLLELIPSISQYISVYLSISDPRYLRS